MEAKNTSVKAQNRTEQSSEGVLTQKDRLRAAMKILIRHIANHADLRTLLNRNNDQEHSSAAYQRRSNSSSDDSTSLP